MAFTSLIWGTTDGEIKTSGLDGSSPTVLFDGVSTLVWGIKTDASSEKIYITHADVLSRYNLDGSGEETLRESIPDWGDHTDISLDLVNGHIYGTSSSFDDPPGRSIIRVDLADGGNWTQLVLTQSGSATIVAVPGTSKLYYGFGAAPHQGIWRLDSDFTIVPVARATYSFPVSGSKSTSWGLSPSARVYSVVSLVPSMSHLLTSSTVVSEVLTAK